MSDHIKIQLFSRVNKYRNDAFNFSISLVSFENFDKILLRTQLS